VVGGGGEDSPEPFRSEGGRAWKFWDLPAGHCLLLAQPIGCHHLSPRTVETEVLNIF
jgi:hypothetical protein